MSVVIGPKGDCVARGVERESMPVVDDYSEGRFQTVEDANGQARKAQICAERRQ
jgi:hypothetical protein